MTADDAHGTPERGSRAAAIRGIGRGLGIVVLTLLCALAAATVVVPRVVGAETYTITGRSMEPAIPLGSYAVVRPVDPDAIRIGDIITFQLDSGRASVATHRVVGFGFIADGERGFVTQGDGNGAADAELVRPEQLRGRLWYSLPFVGRASTLVSGGVRVWLVPLAATSLFVYGGWSIVRGLRDRRRRGAPDPGEPAEERIDYSWTA